MAKKKTASKKTVSVAICNPGPSFDASEVDPEHDIIIAVNRAIADIDADWWAYCDHQALGVIEPVGNPKHYTTRNSVKSASKKSYADKLRMDGLTLVEDCDECLPRSLGHTLYTATAAYSLAVKLGATSITVYGCDMAGDGYHNGDKLQTRDTDARWEREREIQRKCVAHLKTMGVDVYGVN